MKKVVSILLLVVSLLAVSAPVAVAQQGLNLGAVMQIDNDRIEAAPGVSFGAAVFSARPPARGFDSPDLIGLFSSTLGQYPVIYRGLWLKLSVFPGGFRRLEGVDYDPTGQLGKDEKNGWVPLTPEEGGGYSISIQADRLGAVPLRFRVRHRDGRDRYSLLIFTVSWVRGGTLPTAMEIMVQREPHERLMGEEVLPYLRGFIPATATRSDAGVTQQRIDVPPQTVTQTATAGDHNAGTAVRTEEWKPSNSVLLHVWQSQLANSEISDRNSKLTLRGSELVAKAVNQGRQEPHIGTVILDPVRWQTAAVVLHDNRPFRAVFVVRGREVPLEVEGKEGSYRAVLYGSVVNFRDAILNVTDAQGNLRTVTFTDRPEGQER